jgi:hypothetical protein
MQVRLVQTDLREFPGHLFDAVVGRFVLMYLADPAGAVRRVEHYVGSGGIVALSSRDRNHRRGRRGHPLGQPPRSWAP